MAALSTVGEVIHMDEPPMTTCRRCDQRILVAWAWRCSEHDWADRWMCGHCAIEHQLAHGPAVAASCLWWRPVRTVGGQWYQQAVFGSPFTAPD